MSNTTTCHRRLFLGLKAALLRGALVLGAVSLALVLAELGYRIFDPFPYFSPWEINKNQHGNLTEYHPRLGWSGVPGGSARFTTENASVSLQHNASGFRDIEVEERSPGKPAIVFLGDSFTWGYEVEFDEMFVSLLRERRKDFEFFNLAHRGYGTDQALMTFRGWQSERKLHRVVLMFSENDVADNNSDWRNKKGEAQVRTQGRAIDAHQCPGAQGPGMELRDRIPIEPAAGRQFARGVAAEISSVSRRGVQDSRDHGARRALPGKVRSPGLRSDRPAGDAGAPGGDQG